MRRISVSVSYLVFAFIMASCLTDGRLKTDLNMIPASLDDGWPISTPTVEGFNEAALRETYEYFYSESDNVTAISLLIVRNGNLVAEGYCRKMADREEKRNIQSSTKSFTSLVFGIAMDLGYFESLDQRLFDIMPDEFDPNPEKRQITLRHLLTMKSGLDFDNDAFAWELHIDRRHDIMKYILAKPLYAPPGAEYRYRDCDPQLLSGAIRVQTGMTLEEIAQEYLFGPMGIYDYFWEQNTDGQNWAAQALDMKPRDLAKIGLLVLNEGKWDGEPLVSEDWMRRSTSPQSELNNPGYGFYWWIYDPDYLYLQGERVVAAVGSGGQMIFIVPDQNLIVVTTSEPYAAGELGGEWASYSLLSMVIKAIRID